MKNKIITILALITAFIIFNILFLDKFWYSTYSTYKTINKKDVEVLTDAERQEYLEKYTKFNSKMFSVKELYNHISETMKQKYNSLEDFEMYVNENILSKISDQQYYSIRKYVGEEKINGYIKVEYRMYFYDLNTYIDMFESENFDDEKASFSKSIYIIEKSIDDYSIEI